jgi:phospholipase/lecithinase/hemolysin
MVRAERVFRANREQTMVRQTKPWAWTEAEDERLKALVAQGASVVKAAAAPKRTTIPAAAGRPTEVGR